MHILYCNIDIDRDKLDIDMVIQNCHDNEFGIKAMNMTTSGKQRLSRFLVDVESDKSVDVSDVDDDLSGRRDDRETSASRLDAGAVFFRLTQNLERKMRTCVILKCSSFQKSDLFC